MRKSIFEIENRLDIQKEFQKIVQILHYTENTVLTTYIYDGMWIKYKNLLDRMVFKKWKYRDTFLNCDEYLEHIGITIPVIKGTINISQDVFLHYLEFILNMNQIVINKRIIEKSDDIVIATFDNIFLILEKLNYKIEKVEDKIILVKRDADVDSILDKVIVTVTEALLEYNDFRNKNDIEAKKGILKVLDLYIEENKSDIKGLDSKLYDSIGTVVNKMGINHPIKEEPFTKYTNQQLLEWYDKCFLMMIHAIRSIDVNKIKQERQALVCAENKE
jgi:hypothetical protein